MSSRRNLPARLSQWTEPAIQASVMALVERLAATYPIDRPRIYLTGLSRGGRGAIELLANNPRTFALEVAGTRVARGEWAGDNSAGPAQDRAAETDVMLDWLFSNAASR